MTSRRNPNAQKKSPRTGKSEGQESQPRRAPNSILVGNAGECFPRSRRKSRGVDAFHQLESSPRGCGGLF